MKALWTELRFYLSELLIGWAIDVSPKHHPDTDELVIAVGLVMRGRADRMAREQR